MQKKTTFVMNRLTQISEVCKNVPITFKFVSGEQNPADCVTRALSHKQLSKTCYYEGPQFLLDMSKSNFDDYSSITIPNPLVDISEQVSDSYVCQSNDRVELSENELFSGLVKRFSSLDMIQNVIALVMKFIDKLKRRLKCKNSGKYDHVEVRAEDINYAEESFRFLVSCDQKKYFPDLITHFERSSPRLKDIPNLVTQLNVFVDAGGLLRVRSKITHWRLGRSHEFPLLISRESELFKLIVGQYHERLLHAGVYSVLSELRKKIYTPRMFCTVRALIRKCVQCKRFKARPVQLNQGSYRNFRENPPQIPFRCVFIDYLGPFHVKVDKTSTRRKVWLLCVTCTFTRAINLKLCQDLTTSEFLRSFQIHCFEYGLPETCISDMGSQILAGSSVIKDYLKDADTQTYLQQNGISGVEFRSYFKGHSQLGSMVETCVKMVKRLIFGAIRNNVLSHQDFEFLVYQTVSLVNKRPISFKESLRDEELEVPIPITPESIIRGYELISVNIIPDLHPVPSDADWHPKFGPSEVRNSFEKLRDVRQRLIEIYHSEFIGTLISQSVDRKDRYKPVVHQKLSKHDVVLIRETNMKPAHFPLGIVKDIVLGGNGEVTGAIVLKGKTGEITKRHVSTLIPILTSNNVDSESNSMNDSTAISVNEQRPQRKAAVRSREKTKGILESKF